MGIKVRELVEADGVTHRGWIFHCPGCGEPHVCDARWSFNGDRERPTFGPAAPEAQFSILVRGVHRCHSFVTDGRIRFEKDSDHPLKGQEVEIPDWDTRHGPDFGGIRR
jgi:hypothetical protein